MWCSKQVSGHSPYVPLPDISRTLIFRVPFIKPSSAYPIIFLSCNGYTIPDFLSILQAAESRSSGLDQFSYD